jgi:predicted DNA-binding transcriptional regulator YafY
MRRIERLINLIAALLEARRPMTADEIRARIAGYGQEGHEAFRRAFERDKEALRAMGIPLELRSLDPLTQEQGYIIPRERYYLPDLDLEPDELAALAVATETLAGRGDDAASGLLKLAVSGELAPGSPPRSVARADVGVGDPRLGALYSALLEGRRVEFAYTDARGRRSDRRVEPWSLVHRAGHWYLIGRDVVAGERRTFKVTRMGEGVSVVEGAYEVPKGAEAAGAIGAEPWEFGGDALAGVRVRFDAATRWWAEQNLAHLDVAEAGDGALEVAMPTGNAEALLDWVIGWSGAVTISAPEDLRRRLMDHLRPWLEPSRE